MDSANDRPLRDNRQALDPAKLIAFVREVSDPPAAAGEAPRADVA
jgi:hypothetical protein